MISNIFRNKKVFITGGAGFIGPHLLNKLILLGAVITIGDNLSIGKIENILNIWDTNKLKYKKTNWGFQAENGHKFVFVDFQNLKETINSLKGNQIVFHLAATHGGRGFIDSHPADCAENFAINQNVIKASREVKVERMQYASSACVYPIEVQKKYNSSYLLKEQDAFKNNWGNADREYGWTKLMGEVTLKAYFFQYGLRSSITRYVTVYGPGQNESHALIALIKRAAKRESPYLVWGSGNQDRDFTFVDDIVSGTLLACEKIINADAVNLGTSRRYKIKEVVKMIFEILDWQPKKIFFDKSKPEGVKTRALNINKANKLLSWAPAYSLKKGLEKTINWYLKSNGQT